MDLIFGILFISFMFIGIVFSAWAVLFLILKSKRKGEIILLPLDENTQNIDRELAFMSFRHTFCDQNEKIVIVDTGLNNIQREVCEQFIREYPSVLLLTPEKLTEVL